MNEEILYSIGFIALGAIFIWFAKNKEPVEGTDVLLLEYRGWVFGILFILCGIYILWDAIKMYL